MSRGLVVACFHTVHCGGCHVLRNLFSAFEIPSLRFASDLCYKMFGLRGVHEVPCVEIRELVGHSLDLAEFGICEPI